MWPGVGSSDGSTGSGDTAALVSGDGLDAVVERGQVDVECELSDGACHMIGGQHVIECQQVDRGLVSLGVLDTRL